MPKQLQNSLLRELPDLVVHIEDDWRSLVRSASSKGIHPTTILIDAGYGAANITEFRQIEEMYSNANLCLTLNGDCNSTHHIRECLKAGVIHNILPMNLRLDLWLFAVQILLHGGSYMPPELFLSCWKSTEIRP
ncbi:hypothetical protein QW131_31570 [Roseibium salinum]|nr:hypothetical protein [Roseibium salinum]